MHAQLAYTHDVIDKHKTPAKKARSRSRCRVDLLATDVGFDVCLCRFDRSPAARAQTGPALRQNSPLHATSQCFPFSLSHNYTHNYLHQWKFIDLSSVCSFFVHLPHVAAFCSYLAGTVQIEFEHIV